MYIHLKNLKSIYMSKYLQLFQLVFLNTFNDVYNLIILYLLFINLSKILDARQILHMIRSSFTDWHYYINCCYQLQYYWIHRDLPLFYGILWNRLRYPLN